MESNEIVYFFLKWTIVKINFQQLFQIFEQRWQLDLSTPLSEQIWQTSQLAHLEVFWVISRHSTASAVAPAVQGQRQSVPPAALCVSGVTPPVRTSPGYISTVAPGFAAHQMQFHLFHWISLWTHILHTLTFHTCLTSSLSHVGYFQSRLL